MVGVYRFFDCWEGASLALGRGFVMDVLHPCVGGVASLLLSGCGGGVWDLCGAIRAWIFLGFLVSSLPLGCLLPLEWIMLLQWAFMWVVYLSLLCCLSRFPLDGCGYVSFPFFFKRFSGDNQAFIFPLFLVYPIELVHSSTKEKSYGIIFMGWIMLGALYALFF